jgi:Tol biopolymer transport system component
MVDQPTYLEVSAIDGSGARRIATAYSPAAWAPDGSGRIVFSDRQGLKLRKPSGQVITLDAVPDSELASWSPDSTRIVFSVSTNSAVWVVNADGSGLRALTPTIRDEPHAFVFFSSWSPDGARVAFTRECCDRPQARESDVWVVSSDGTNSHPLTSSHDVSSRPLWSPSGDSIAYLAKADPAAVTGTVFVINGDGTNPRKVAAAAQLVAFFRRGGR